MKRAIDKLPYPFLFIFFKYLNTAHFDKPKKTASFESTYLAIMTNEQHSICKQPTFDTFFKEQAKGLRNFLFYKFGDMPLAEDLVQESFIKLWNNCLKVPVQKAKSYVYTVAVNLGTSAMRHQQVKFKYKNYVTHHSKNSTNESPEFILLEKEYLEKFKNAIASLPDRQREVFLLSRVEKKTYKEIAALSKVSVKAIEKLMHKALVKLRTTLGNI